MGGQQAHTAIKTLALKHTGGENSACRLLGHILESKKNRNQFGINISRGHDKTGIKNKNLKHIKNNISESWNQGENKSEG